MAQEQQPLPRLRYQDLAKVLRDSSPGLFDDASDEELVHAAVTSDPKLKDFIIADPLEGIEIAGLPRRISPGGPPLAATVPTVRAPQHGVVTGAAMAARIVPEVALSILGTGLGATAGLSGGPAAVGTVPAGAIMGNRVGGATGAAIGELIAQEIELAFGAREERNPLLAGTSAALGAIVPKPLRAGGSVALGVVRRGAQGAAFGVADTTARSVIEEGQLPSMESVGLATGMGLVLGTGFGGFEARGITRRRGAAAAEADNIRQQIEAQLTKNAADDAAEAAAEEAANNALKQQAFQALLDDGVPPEQAIAIVEEGASLFGKGPAGLLPEQAGPSSGGGTGIATRVDPQGNATLPQLDRLDPNGPPILGREGDPGPPPTLTDQLETQIRESLENNTSGLGGRANLVTEKGIRLTSDIGPPRLDLSAPAQGRLPGTVPRQRVKARTPGRPLKVRPEGGGRQRQPTVAEASADVASVQGQRRLRDIDIDDIPDGAMDDPGFAAAARQAVLDGYDGSPGELWRRWQEQLDAADDINAGSVDADRLLLQRIASLGGVGADANTTFPGEVRALLEMRPTAARRGRRIKNPNSPNAFAKDSIVTLDQIGGVRGVVKAAGKGGRDLDSLAENLLASDGFEISGGDELLRAIFKAEENIRLKAEGRLPGDVPVNDKSGWWERGIDQDAAAATADALEESARRVGTAELDGAQDQLLRVLTGAEEADVISQVRMLNEEGAKVGLPGMLPKGVKPRSIFQQIKDKLCG